MKKLFLLLFTVTFIWNVNAQKKAGFVGIATSVATIADDDEKAAATWFTNTYGGDYIPVADLGTTDLTQYGVLWIHVDKQDGKGDAYDEIYAKATELKNYYKAGGNLLLSIHANNLLTEFGRVNEWPDLVAAGGGGLNPDMWSLNPVYGTYNNTVVTHNKATDPLYAGLTTEPVTRDNGNAYVVMPLIGNGWKEDHNCFWSMTIDGNVIGNGEEAKLNTWETTYNVDALGSWGQVQDYFGAAIARWKPQGDFKGTAITIGIGAYEWNINQGGPNPFQANIERLTKNALDELKNGTVIVNPVDKKAGFVGLASSVATIADDDEKAAATWFTNTYGGDYIPVADLGTADLTQYGVLWIHVDKQDGAGDAYDEFYAKATELKNFYKAGGNMLLSIHANNLLTEFGRVVEWPDLVAAGGGGLNPDMWSLNPVYGTYNNTVVTHNKSTDPLYAGLTTEPVTRDNGNAYVVFPLIGNGWKEDHNCFWSMTIDGNVIGNGEEAKLNTWETTYNVDALGSWGQVQDYFGAAIARWKPQGDFKGTAITIGVGAYEWNINQGGPNPYQANIEKLTKNALDELKAVKTSLKNAGTVINSQVYVSNNQLMIKNAENVNSVMIYNISGSMLISANANIHNGINISNLSSGIYIIKATDENGNVLVLNKFIK